MLLVILKIIGTILLAILGILILFLSIVLFVPLRYVIDAKSTGDLKSLRAEAKFHWLLHLFSGRVLYENEELKYKIRLLWMKLADSEEVEEPKREEQVSEKVSEKNVKETTAEFADKVTETSVEEPVAETVEDVKTEKKEKAKENKLEKIKCTIKNLCDKIKMVLEFLKDEAHQNTMKCLKKEMIRLLKFLNPKSLKGRVRFGMEDPYVTGQILAVLSVLYPFYAEKVEIYPEFDQKVLEGEVHIKGHIRGIYVPIIAIRLISNKDVRTTIKDVQALF